MSDALRIYDITIDAHRPATQTDIDNLMAVGRAYGRIRMASKRNELVFDLLEEIHTELQASLR